MHSIDTQAVSLDEVDVLRGRTLALQGVNVSVPRGAVAAVVGANGAGKSTLFGVIGGRLRPSAGRVRVNGPVAEVLQTTSVDEHLPMTVQEVVLQGRYPDRGLLRPFTKTDHRIVDEALEAVAMRNIAAHPSVRFLGVNVSGYSSLRASLSSHRSCCSTNQ